MNSLIPSIPVTYWKAILCTGLLPLNFVPFKTLSLSSILGICCVMSLILLVITDGLIKPHTPGSLREVAQTYAFPATWKTIPLSIGLFMSPWGGHSVFPAIYKDMRHPQKYAKAVRNTYIFTYGLDLTMAVVGYLMFGDRVRDEITSNILNAKSGAYPRIISIIVVILIAIVPITKIPLSNRPIQDTINKKFYVDLRQMDAKARALSEQSFAHKLGRASIAVLCNTSQLGIAILLPDFDNIMALMGSAFCLTICIIFPIGFYLRLFWGSGEIKVLEMIFCFLVIAVATVLAVIGTIFAILPKEKVGAKAVGYTMPV
ncbi:hypothetical protein LTR66_014954 [Elasticomyces elasticus]|nr:hypothetical protein LTR66_014954 [Elasticomyces elasticus]